MRTLTKMFKLTQAYCKADKAIIGKLLHPSKWLLKQTEIYKICSIHIWKPKTNELGMLALRHIKE